MSKLTNQSFVWYTQSQKQISKVVSSFFWITLYGSVISTDIQKGHTVVHNAVQVNQIRINKVGSWKPFMGLHSSMRDAHL